MDLMQKTVYADHFSGDAKPGRLNETGLSPFDATWRGQSETCDQGI
tara:strand:+ start:171 stop:308 length:138 start_codon:yes stop_codon:yes gene_type:complete